jgi:hypothetical protein
VTPNVCYALLDAAIIGGRGEEPFVVAGTRVWSHARLLEEVAALGGVLRHLGVGVGVPCVVDLAPGPATDLDAVVSALAIARLGGVVTTQPDASAPVVVTAGSSPPLEGQQRLVRGEPGTPVPEPDLDGVVMIRAGRTDPAACEVLAPDAPYSPERTVAEEIAVLEGHPTPYDVTDLRRLLRA